MRTSSRSLAVLLFDEVELLDVAAPLQVLTMAGRTWNFRPFKVTLVATRRDLVETRNQVRLEARATLDELREPETLLVPGGYGARRTLNEPAVVAWTAHAALHAESVIAVGNGVLLLAKAGVLANTDVAVATEAVELLASLEPTAKPDTSRPFVEAGKILTASAPLGGAKAALHLVSRVVGAKQANTVAAAIGLGADVATVEILKME
jgi:transcriptional regulator GlxA family with amidase domain